MLQRTMHDTHPSFASLTGTCMLCWCCSYCAPALASSAYALALMRYLPCSGWMNSLLAESCRQLPAFGAQELSNLLWAVAVLRVRPGNEWLQEVVHQVGSRALCGWLCCGKIGGWLFVDKVVVGWTRAIMCCCKLLLLLFFGWCGQWHY